MGGCETFKHFWQIFHGLEKIRLSKKNKFIEFAIKKMKVSETSIGKFYKIRKNTSFL